MGGERQLPRGPRSAPPPPAFDAEVCRGWRTLLEAEGTRRGALTFVLAHAIALAFGSEEGSQLVVRAMEVGDGGTRRGLAARFSGRMFDMMGSPHAKRVLWRLLELEDVEHLLDAELAEVCNRALPLSFESEETSRRVQRAMEVADGPRRSSFRMAFSEGILEMAVDYHANYAAQKAFQVEEGDLLTSEELCALIRGLWDQVGFVVRHKTGCRIIRELAKYHLNRLECGWLFKEVLSEAVALCRHEFAHYAIQAIIQHPDADWQRSWIGCALWQNLPTYVRCRDTHLVFVLQDFVRHGSGEQVVSLGALLSYLIVDVTATKDGCVLYRELCEHPHTRQEAVAALQGAAARLCERKESRRLVAGVLGGPAEAPRETPAVPAAVGAGRAGAGLPGLAQGPQPATLDTSTGQATGLGLAHVSQASAWAHLLDDLDNDDYAVLQRFRLGDHHDDSAVDGFEDDETWAPPRTPRYQ
ncbi:unnamed protein product [Prorocentrum cordatum]|uniref:Uncharacterized protein n=1 Tax=Prorocentrum cordatum TaxID=2364126 RepID=A0ABN9QY27_9DINO|nr:unnamed protein product [Polarella glacialis]